MRLGQLARKLAIRPSDIVTFLESHNIVIDGGSNTRLDDVHVVTIMEHYAPALVEEIKTELAEESKEETNIQAVEQSEEPEEQVTAISPETDIILPVSESNDPSAEFQEVEVIKVPKIALPGLKVVGKIDLPEPKKKEVAEGSEEMVNAESIQEEKPKRVDRRSSPRGKSHERPRKNPIAVQREREAREAERKRKEELERIKEARKRNYYKKVKSKIEVEKPVKAAKQSKRAAKPVQVKTATKPTSIWGKFTAWLFRK